MAQTIQLQIACGAHQSIGLEHRLGHSWIARKYTNLIRIQRAKSVTNKQVLPNTLSLNTKTVPKKSDELVHVIHETRHSNGISNLAF